jgi:hypothetical protein
MDSQKRLGHVISMGGSAMGTFLQDLKQSKVEDRLKVLGLMGTAVFLVGLVFGFVFATVLPWYLHGFKEATWPILLSGVVAFLMGIIAKKLVEVFLHEQNRVVPIALFLVLAVTGIGLPFLFNKVGALEKQLDGSVAKPLAAQLGALSQQIDARIGIPAELEIEDYQRSTGAFYRKLLPYINAASPDDEILVVSPYTPQATADESGISKEHKEARSAYLEALIKKAKDGIKYRRIVCFPEGADTGKIQSKRLPGWVVDHCKEMYDLQSSNPARVSLKKCATIIDPDILVIGKKMAAITVSVRDPATSKELRIGTFVFHSPPNAQIIEELYSMFWRVDNLSRPVSMVPET